MLPSENPRRGELPETGDADITRSDDEWRAPAGSRDTRLPAVEADRHLQAQSSMFQEKPTFDGLFLIPVTADFQISGFGRA